MDLVTTTLPKLGPGQFLIQNEAITLNSAGWKIQENGVWVEKFPAITGMGLASSVVEIGEGVSQSTSLCGLVGSTHILHEHTHCFSFTGRS